ncbi:uncharacterized protein LOC143284089 [Babylonia areolata]|uniref:uncharacterized protein LOC143284089 n=1 Tax=Babylonia areolata TaxID=304850 RepID=UPI003FD09D1A
MTLPGGPVLRACLLVFTVSLSAPSSATPPTPPASLDLARLPPPWNTACHVQQYDDDDDDINATVSCLVSPHDDIVWQLKDLTSSRVFHGSTNLQIAAKIECETGGKIGLSPIFNLPGPVKLTVRNCWLLDTQFDIGFILSQSVRVMDIRNCVWLYDLQKGAKSLAHTDIGLLGLTDMYSFGLVTYINKNTSYYDTTLFTLGMIDSDRSHDDQCDAALSPVFQDKNMTYPQDLACMFHTEFIFDASLEYFFMRGRLSKTCLLQLEHQYSRHLHDAVSDPLEPFPEQCKRWKIEKTFIGTQLTGPRRQYHHLQLFDESYSSYLPTFYFSRLANRFEFPQLRKMNFSHTFLRKIPDEILAWRIRFEAPKLEFIDLSYCHIRQIGRIAPSASRHGVTTTLDLQHNRITEVTLQMVDSWAQVPDFRLDIRNNPIDCVCSVRDLITQLQNDTRFASPVMNYYRQQISSMTCATPSRLEGRRVVSLTMTDLACPVVEKNPGHKLVPDVKAVVVIVGVAVVVVVLLGLAVRYRREVRILMYTRAHVLLPCGLPSRQSPAVVPEKTYDAFVAYAHQDSDWVLGFLVSRLEHTGGGPQAGRPCKLCIHQRDFVVGKPIVDNIADSIADSRHTVVVLSNSFVKSAWAMEELHQAYYQSLQERSRHLVMVLLEKVNPSDMDPLVRSCCRTFTYLSVSDPFFWDRLLFSIQVEDAGHQKNQSQSQIPEPSAGDTPMSNAVDEEFSKTALFSESMLVS